MMSKVDSVRLLRYILKLIWLVLVVARVLTLGKDMDCGNLDILERLAKLMSD
jgi:hypothetical protein